MCKSQNPIVVGSSFCGAQNHKRSTRNKHTVKPFVKTKAQKIWWRNSNATMIPMMDPVRGAMMPP